jgi:hypothetical protein
MPPEQPATKIVTDQRPLTVSNIVLDCHSTTRGAREESLAHPYWRTYVSGASSYRVIVRNIIHVPRGRFPDLIFDLCPVFASSHRSCLPNPQGHRSSCAQDFSTIYTEYIIITWPHQAHNTQSVPTLSPTLDESDFESHNFCL